jgi:hypothetical protein
MIQLAVSNRSRLKCITQQGRVCLIKRHQESTELAGTSRMPQIAEDFVFRGCFIQFIEKCKICV